MATEWNDPLNSGGYKHQSTDYEVAGKSGKKYPLYISYTSAGGFPNYVYSVKIGDKYYQVSSDVHTTAFNKGQLPTNSDIEKEIKFGELKQVRFNDEANNPTNVYSNIGNLGYTPTQKSKEMKAGTYTLDNKSAIAYTTDGKNYYYYDGSKKVPITDTNKLTLSNSYTNAKGIADSIMNNTNSILSSIFGTNTSKDTVYKEQDVPNYFTNIGGIDNVAPVSANQPRLMSAAELAALYGINYDYDYILNMLNEGTDMYLNEMTEKAKKLQGDSLRNQSALYQQYLDTLRESRANAVNTGINRGALAAQELGQYLLTQQQIGQSQSEFNNNIYDLYNQAITEKAKNKTTAYDKYNSLGQALMSASANLNANDVQRYAADMAYASQLSYSNAYAKAAATSAQNNWDVAWLNSLSNPSNTWAAELYKKGQLASVNQANAQANYYNSQKKE